MYSSLRFLLTMRDDPIRFDLREWKPAALGSDTNFLLENFFLNYAEIEWKRTKSHYLEEKMFFHIFSIFPEFFAVLKLILME